VVWVVGGWGGGVEWGGGGGGVVWGGGGGVSPPPSKMQSAESPRVIIYAPIHHGSLLPSRAAVVKPPKSNVPRVEGADTVMDPSKWIWATVSARK